MAEKHIDAVEYGKTNIRTGTPAGATTTPAKSDTAMVNTSTSMTPTKRETPAISMVDPALAQLQADEATNGKLTGREKNITGQGKEIYKRGEGLGTGPVGSADGYVGRPVPATTEEPDDQTLNTGAGSGLTGNGTGAGGTTGTTGTTGEGTATPDTGTGATGGAVGGRTSSYRSGSEGGYGVTVDLGKAPKAPEAPDLKPLLDQWRTAAEQQQQAKIDYATQQGIDELTRAEEDARIQFRNAQEQIAAEEMAARDNQALYAEARGDKGGIGAAQYDAVANTAAINRQSVKDAQTKLSTDTARQIADLRAKGEFDKADAVLEIAQTYLSNLMSLEQWAANYGLSAAQFEESIREWEANFEKSVGEMMGEYKGKQTLAARNGDRNFELQESNVTGYYGGNPTYTREKANKDTANATVEAYLSAGIMPSDDLLAASDYTPELVQATLMAAKAKTGSGGSGSGAVSADAYGIMQKAGATTEGEAYNALRNAGYKDGEAKTFAQYYVADLKAAGDTTGPDLGSSDTASTEITAAMMSWADGLKRSMTSNTQKEALLEQTAANNGWSENQTIWVAQQIGLI